MQKKLTFTPTPPPRVTDLTLQTLTMTSIESSSLKNVALSAGALTAAYGLYSVLKAKSKQAEAGPTIMDGNAIKKAVLEELTVEVAEMKEKHGIVPGLAVRHH